MRIGLDARGLISWQEYGGAGQYAYQLIRNLPEMDVHNEYCLIFNFIRTRHRPRRGFMSAPLKILNEIIEYYRAQPRERW